MIPDIFNVELFIGGVKIGTATTTEELTDLLADPEVGYGKFSGCKPVEISIKVDEHSTSMRLLRNFAAPDRFIAPSEPTTGPRNRWGGLK